MDFDPATSSASRILQQLRKGTLGSRELLDTLLARIERLNPMVNAVVTLDRDGARRAANRMDERSRTDPGTTPLHGLSMTVKDTLETAGMRTTAGALDKHIPEHDAVAVQRLREAGALVFGKTNTPAWGADLQTWNTIFGQTNNPWDTRHTCGGSSGGAATAVALGLTPLEVGSDIGGSLRNPAHYCGVYSHKPSQGLIPQRGHIPGPPGTVGPSDLAVIGPLARDAEDLALALALLCGPEKLDGTAWRLEIPPPRQRNAGEFRVAVWLDDPACPVDSNVGDVLQQTVDRLARGGVKLHETKPGIALPEALDIYLRLLYPVTGAGLPEKIRARLARTAEQAADDDHSWPTRMARYSLLGHRDWLIANEIRYRYRSIWHDFFGDVDVLLTPVTPVTAPRHDHSGDLMQRSIEVNGQSRNYWEQMTWAGALATLAGLPATTAPVGLARNGLPVGIQIIGPWLEDYTPIAFASALAAFTGGFQPPPEPRPS